MSWDLRLRSRLEMRSANLFLACSWFFWPFCGAGSSLGSPLPPPPTIDFSRLRQSVSPTPPSSGQGYIPRGSPAKHPPHSHLNFDPGLLPLRM